MGVPVLSTNASCTGNACTTTAVTTTGVTLLILGESCFNATCAVPSDSKGNSWTGFGNQNPQGAANDELWYSTNPIVGASHTFKGGANSYGLCIMAFSGVIAASNPLDQTNAATTGGATSLQPGNVTPTQNNEALVTYIGGTANSNTYGIDSGFTITNQMSFVGGVNYGQACAYFVQGSPATINPKWSYSTSDVGGSQIATFKAAVSATSTIPNNLFTIKGGKASILGGKVVIQ